MRFEFVEWDGVTACLKGEFRKELDRIKVTVTHGGYLDDVENDYSTGTGVPDPFWKESVVFRSAKFVH